jgi:hypothetical protein
VSVAVHEGTADADTSRHVLEADGPVENIGEAAERLKNLPNAVLAFLGSLHGSAPRF